MDSVRAALLLQGHQFSPEAMLVFTSLIAIWAVARPTTIRDSDNRPLPPNLTARLIIVLMYALGYAGLVAAFVFGKSFVMSVISSAPTQIESAFKSVENQSPLLAVMALVGLQSLAPFREAERAFIIWIHSVRHLHGDVNTLIAHLQTCAFTPSDVEHQKNIDELARHNIFLTDTNSRGIDLPSVQTWRKLTTMLRRLREWNKDQRRVLSDAQMEMLDELEKAHARKTRLAAEILRLLNLVSTGKDATEVLSQLSTLLAGASHSDRSSVAGMEAQLKGLLGGGELSPSMPLRLSSTELQAFLSQIDGYFQVEYQILLRQVAELTSLSIIYAGDLAPDRLQEMKKLGFQGLGRIEPVSFDRILWLFITISIGGFCILYLLRYQELRSMPGANNRGLLLGFGVFSLTMALAALVGAAFGSNKRHVHAQYTPWGVYFTAGLISAVMFETAHAVRLLLTADGGIGSAPGQALPLYHQVSWAVIPFLLTVGICRLARMNHWFTPIRWLPTPTARAIWERCLDGTALAVLMFLAYSSAIILHDVLDIPLPGSLKDAPFNPNIYLPMMLFGFLIGGVAVRDARRAGLATIIDRGKPLDTSEEKSLQRSTWPMQRHLAGEPAE
jgi:hypothetical protein